MKETLLKTDTFHWLDLVSPTEEELREVALKYELPSSFVRDCLDADHLPKYERVAELNFALFRGYDEASPHEGDTVQELTRKVAVFYSESFLVSIHRKDQPYLTLIKSKWREAKSLPKAPVAAILYDLFRGVIHSYEPPIDRALTELEELEMGVFEAAGAKPFDLKEGYYLKRKAFVFKRMLRMSMDLLSKMSGDFPRKQGNTEYQSIHELAESCYFYVEELSESVNSLLNLHLSLASQRTNEVMRILTVFSVFLLPLNLLTGIYGMNFEHIPGLKWVWGYPTLLFSMGGMSVGIFLWFKRKGWLK